MFNQKKLGAQRYKDESKAVNSEETDRVKNQFGLWSSIQGHTSETGCQLPGTEQGAVLDSLSADESVARGSDALQQRVCRTGDGEGFHRDSGCRIFGCGDGAPRGLPV